MVLMAGMDLPLHAVREQISSAFDLIVHLSRAADGTRKVVQISEVQGMEGKVIVMQDLFKYVQTGIREGRVHGHFTATGVRPKFMTKIETAGFHVPASTFAPAREGRRRR
jgi:pilus assembly protein CpaF